MYTIVVESYGKYGNIIHAKGGNWKRNFLRRNTTGIIYIVSNFTQEICEMDSKQLADYVACHHLDVL